MNDDEIRKLFDDELKPAIAIAAAMNRLAELSKKNPTVPELFFHTAKRHKYTFERVPYGKGMGWRCFDPNKYDGDPADGDTTCGYGLTEDHAYIDYLNRIEDGEPLKPRTEAVGLGNPFQPPELRVVRSRDPDEDTQ